MSDEVYSKLREYLHSMPGGYPPTKTGVEIRILEKLFTPEEAELFLQLTSEPEEASEIASKHGLDEKHAAEKLEDMAVRGLVFRVRDGDKKLYRTFQFFIGIIDAQINRADAEFAQMMLEYFPQLGMTRATLKTKQMRVIPIAKTVEAKTTVSTYNRLRDLITDKDLIAVAPCLCRQMGDARGNECDHPRETCLSFGEHAQYYIDNGVGRQITKDELMKLVELAEDEGLVINTSNAAAVEIVCLCCKCHCGVLNGLKILPQTGFLVNAFYKAKIDPELCSACGDCVERCTIKAIKEGDVMEVIEPKCIGCGLCVTSCPEEAIALIDTTDSREPYKDVDEMLTTVSKERGLV